MALVPLFKRNPGRAIVTPDDAIPPAPRRRNGKGQLSRRPHSDATVEQVRHLVETSTLTYDDISTRTGVGRASISRWARDMEWLRPEDAPRSTDRMPRHRLSQKLKLRLLGERLRRLAERHIVDLENAAAIDPDKMLQALQVLKMARLHIQGRRRRRKPWMSRPQTGRQWLDEQEAIRTALREMHRGGVTVDRAPEEAIELWLAAYRPPENPAFLPRKKPRRI